MKENNKKVIQRYFDYSLVFVTIFIVGFGLIMIYSTSSYTAQLKHDGNAEYFFVKQLIYTILGFIGMYITYRLDYHIWRKLAVYVLIGCIILIIALIPFGSEANGATRWIRFAGIGVQPADVAKFGVIVTTSALVCRFGSKVKKLRYIVLITLVTGGLLALLVGFISSNMSSALIIFGISFIMTFVAYPGYKPYVVLLALGAAGVTALISWVKSLISSGHVASGFRLNRIIVWMNPENYASGTGYQTLQGLYAIGSGGLFGKGLGKSLQKLGFIPESQNDMIFSIICEELGLFGAILVILFFTIMLWRIVHIAQNAPDLFGTMLATGVFAHIAIQVILNIAVVTNFIPNTGVSLPFISYGGSSSVVLLAEMGVVLNVSGKIRLER